MMKSILQVTFTSVLLSIVVLFVNSSASFSQTNIWFQKSDLGYSAPNIPEPSARAGAVGFSIGSKGYVGMGEDGNLRSDFWEYDPALNTWTQKADFGGGERSDAVGFSINNKGYVGTGYDGGCKKDFWEYDPETNTWQKKKPFGGIARKEAVGFSIGGKGYIGTGFNTNNGDDYQNDFWEYDPDTDTWTEKANFPGSLRRSAVGFGIGSNGYLGTGGYGNNNDNFKDFWKFSPSANIWTPKAEFGGTPRREAVGFSLGTKGYIGTGKGAVYKTDFWEYDPENNNWTNKADCGGTGRSEAVGFSIVNYAYIGTGIIYEFENAYRKDFWEYNPANDIWIQKADFNGTARQFAVGFSIDTKGYLGTGQQSNGYLKDFWEYDAASDSWSQKADFAGESRRSAVGFSIGSKGYIGTGYSKNNGPEFFKDFWEYDPTFNTWTQKMEFGGAGRCDAVGFSVGDKGYIGTGGNAAYLKDFWEYNPLLNNWSQKTDFPGIARTQAVGFRIGSKGYIGTGYHNPDVFKDFWEYNPVTDIWLQKADFGGYARRGAAGFSILSHGFVGTGEANNSQKDFWEYEPATNTWKQRADFEGTSREFGTGFSIGDKGYLGTGNDGAYAKDIWEYTPFPCLGFSVYADMDADGYGNTSDSLFAADCFLPNGYAANNTDCNDSNAFVNPLAIEICDNFDNNCDGNIDEGVVTAFYADDDNDGFGNPGTLINSCTQPSGYVTNDNDCDDNNSALNPSAVEVCDNIDNNCNGNIDEGLSSAFYADFDNDGFGNPDIIVDSCAQPSGYVINNSDCNDTIADIFPGAQEILFNGLDDNCDGYIDEFGTGLTEVNTSSFFTIFPNPTNTQTNIQFTLLHASHVSVVVFDLSGKKINTLIDEALQQGDHSLQLNTAQFSKGIYFVRMISIDGIHTEKLIIQ